MQRFTVTVEVVPAGSGRFSEEGVATLVGDCLREFFRVARAECAKTLENKGDVVPKRHRVELSNGEVLLVEEGHDCLRLATEDAQFKNWVEAYVAVVDANGVTDLVADRDHAATLTRGLGGGHAESTGKQGN